MWFKNLRLYQLTKNALPKDEELLENQLREQEFNECGSQDLQSIGWVSPLGKHGKMLNHQIAQCVVFCAKKQEKVLPASVINELLNDRIADIEESEARKVYKKERTQLKDDLVCELLPRAFTKSRLTYGYIDTKKQWLIVDASSAAGAEELINLLRHSLGSLSLVPWSTVQLPTDTLTSWLEHIPGGDFELGFEAELTSRVVDGGTARVKDQDLGSDEIRSMLENGKRVKKLSLLWRDQISAVVDDELAVKRLKFTEVFEESMDLPDTDSITAQLDQELNIMCLSLREYLESLSNAMGGLKKIS